MKTVTVIKNDKFRPVGYYRHNDKNTSVIQLFIPKNSMYFNFIAEGFKWETHELNAIGEKRTREHEVIEAYDGVFIDFVIDGFLTKAVGHSTFQVVGYSNQKRWLSGVMLLTIMEGIKKDNLFYE